MILLWKKQNFRTAFHTLNQNDVILGVFSSLRGTSSIPGYTTLRQIIQNKRLTIDKLYAVWIPPAGLNPVISSSVFVLQLKNWQRHKVE